MININVIQDELVSVFDKRNKYITVVNLPLFAFERLKNFFFHLLFAEQYQSPTAGLKYITTVFMYLFCYVEKLLSFWCLRLVCTQHDRDGANLAIYYSRAQETNRKLRKRSTYIIDCSSKKESKEKNKRANKSKPMNKQDQEQKQNVVPSAKRTVSNSKLLKSECLIYWNNIEFVELLCVGYLRKIFQFYNICQNPNDIATILFKLLIDKLQIDYINNLVYTPNVLILDDGCTIDCHFDNNQTDIINAQKLNDSHSHGYNFVNRTRRSLMQLPNTEHKYYSTIIFKPMINDIFQIGKKGNLKSRGHMHRPKLQETHSCNIRFIDNKCSIKKYLFECGIIGIPKKYKYDYIQFTRNIMKKMNISNISQISKLNLSKMNEVNEMANINTLFDMNDIVSDIKLANMNNIDNNNTFHKFRTTKHIGYNSFKLNNIKEKNANLFCNWQSYYITLEHKHNYLGKNQYNTLQRVDHDNVSKFKHGDVISIKITKNSKDHCYSLSFSCNNKEIKCQSRFGGFDALDFDEYSYYYSLASIHCTCANTNTKKKKIEKVAKGSHFQVTMSHNTGSS